MNMENFFFAFGLTFLAGISTGIGGLFAFFSKRVNTSFLSASLGLSAGVMIYVSFVEIIPKAFESLINVFGESKGEIVTVLSFFAGIILIAIIDRFVPEAENPHELKDVKEMDKKEHDENERKKLMRMGLFSAAAIAIHNFPEGLATFVSAMEDPTLGISIAVAIAIHNVPEGIAVSVPLYYATGNRKKALFFSFLSGLAEPLGALVGFFFLRWLFDDSVFGIVFAVVAGIMVYISLDELLPTAEKYGKHHVAIYGLISGMALMAVSLLIF
ncbi:MAG: zinc transporter ZupT [bacterium]